MKKYPMKEKMRYQEQGEEIRKVLQAVRMETKEVSYRAHKNVGGQSIVVLTDTCEAMSLYGQQKKIIEWGNS